ncbi:MAG: immunoglobulin domain-containing protein, partial [Chlamydiia bacterium]|nr:immunoglobulin domain-containing protein [Chlamydiia bacterium]
YLFAEGGSGDSLKWYLGDICTNSNAVLLGVGDTLDLFAQGLIPTETSIYSVRWETYCESGVSASNCLTIDVFVDGDFSIATQPNNVSVCNSGSEQAVFNVEVSLGESLSEIFYQWYMNDAVEIIGATSNELTITDVILSDSGYYFCKVYNTCDTLYSDSAFLSVNAFPIILTQPTLLDTICEGDSITFTIEANGTAVLQYQWYLNDFPTASIDTFLTINPVDYTHTGDYYCEVSNVCGSISSDVVSMEVDTIPVVTQQPLDQIVCLNGLAEFLLAAQGTMPLSYQWYKIDNADVASVVTGETSELMQIINVQETDTAFRYFCFVSNECSDGISSDTVSLAMHAQIQIIDSITSDVNNICHDYSNFIRLTVYGGQGDELHWFTGGCDDVEIYVSNDTIYDIQVPPVTTTYYARWENVCGESACDSVVINVVQEPVMITELEFEDNQICYNAYDSLRISAVGGEGDSIYWYAGFSCNGEPFAVTADTFVYIHDMPINSVPYAAQWVNVCGESNCIVGNLYINEFTYITDQTENVDVCEGAIGEMEVIAEGMDQLYYQWFFNGSPIAGMNENDLSVGPVTVADTGQYYCQVYSDCDTTLSDSIPLVMFELPYYNLQPVDIWACEGGYDTLRISVAGAEPIDLRWFVNGISFGSFTIEDTTYVVGPAINSKEYYAKITNLCGSQISDTAIFTVFDTLVINEQPKDQSLCLLDTARFN